MTLAGRWGQHLVGRHFVGEFGPSHYIHVYAIAPKGGGMVKFGRAMDVKKRFSSIQTATRAGSRRVRGADDHRSRSVVSDADRPPAMVTHPEEA
jgi:hypothetical protein